MIGLFSIVIVIGAGLGWCQQQQQPLAAEASLNPENAVAASDFSANPVWTVGEVQRIRWATTYNDYTISLWQQNIDESDSALQGPTIFQSRAAISFTQYDWVPQIFDFDLSDSNVFFLRLRPGTGTTKPGATDAPSMRSCHFNITISSSSSSSSPPSTRPPSVLPRAVTATEVDQTNPTIPPSYTALTLDTAPPPPSRVPSQGAALHATYIIAGASSSSTAATPEPLSTGAKIGIGVGAGVGGVVLVVGGVLLTFRRARKRDSAMRLSTLKDLPTLPRVVGGGGDGGGGFESPQFYQLKEDYPSTLSTKGHHRQVTISETRLGYYPRAAELG
ncbi:uncharacterized protein PG986_011578 [Apiospora aurea]|uniref:Mid2 domain-containing protein n=1 Tax=Apiospora aurea TaxID=335848 RepID=A0ABR1PXJ6_9PEZI